jgi:hypothetical protein
VVIALLAVLARMVIVPWAAGEKTRGGVLDIFFRWDSGWFLSVVQNGYFYDPNTGSSIAFFPLYPGIVWLLSFGNRVDPIPIGYAVSILCQTIACMVLWRIAMRHFGDERIATMSYRLMLLFPAAFFSSIFYSEGLFLCLFTLSLDACDRRAWREASLWAFLLALTRAAGVLLVVPVVIGILESWRQRDGARTSWQAILPALGAISGVALYFGYLWWAFGDPLAYNATQKHWGRMIASPHLPFVDGVHNAQIGPFYKIFYRGSLYSFGLVALYAVWRRMPLQWISLLVVVPLFYSSTTVLDSIPRYLSTVFPFFLVVAQFSVRYPSVGAMIVLLFAMLQMLCVSLFTNGYWFT